MKKIEESRGSFFFDRGVVPFHPAVITPLLINIHTQKNLGLGIYPYPILKPKIVFGTQKLCVLSMAIGYGYHTNTHI